jgi:hypothetical protein
VTIVLDLKLLLLSTCLQTWVRIQKPVVTYDIVTFDIKAVCPDLFATLPYFFAGENLILFANNC